MDLLKKESTIFLTGGFKPSNTIGESWIGAVKWKMENEETPIDSNGKPMLALATFFLDNLPFIPKELKDFKLITIFISDTLRPTTDSEITNDVVIRTYTNLDNLIPNNSEDENEFTPFPLKATYIDDDMPSWEELESDTIALIDEYEEDGDFDYYSLGNEIIGHKIGGYPINEYQGYQPLITITSDEKANIEFMYDDENSLYFYYNPEIKNWKVYIYRP